MLTTHQELATLILGEDARGWVKNERNKGHSFRRIASNLRQLTNGKVDVTNETIRRWVSEDTETGAA